MWDKEKYKTPLIVSLILLIPMVPLGGMLTYILAGVFGSLVMGYLVSFFLMGCVLASPFFHAVEEEYDLRKWQKKLIKAGLVVVCGLIAFGGHLLISLF